MGVSSMTQKELYEQLKAIGFPVAYYSFSEEQTAPYLVYLFSYSSDLVADNINYHEVSNFQIELYTYNKDLTSEKAVEDKLKEINLPYRKLETYIEDEKVYQITYLVTI